MPAHREPATGLSDPDGPGRRDLGRIGALARESLICVVYMFAASGCLVAEPPEYQAPAQTPPILDLFRADPPLRQVLARPYDEPINFNVPVRSEDAGDPLLATVHLDWGFPEAAPQNENIEISASTFDDQTRVITFDWEAKQQVSEGCHQLTLLVFHKSNLDFARQRSLDTDDQAIATWWLNVLGPNNTVPRTLQNCPPVSGSGAMQ